MIFVCNYDVRVVFVVFNGKEGFKNICILIYDMIILRILL